MNVEIMPHRPNNMKKWLIPREPQLDDVSDACHSVTCSPLLCHRAAALSVLATFHVIKSILEDARKIGSSWLFSWGCGTETSTRAFSELL